MGVNTGPLTLVSPAGMAPGALYSALVHLAPSRLVVVTSREASAGVFQALEAYAERTGELAIEPWVLTLNDPHTGFDEAASVSAEIRAAVIDDDNLVVNLTGGSTVLQFAMLYVALPLPHARLVAVSDRRPREQQLTDPFVVGNLTDVKRPDEASSSL